LKAQGALYHRKTIERDEHRNHHVEENDGSHNASRTRSKDMNIQQEPKALQVLMKDLWICKPTDMSRGRNIFLVDDISQLHNFNYPCIVQRYITNPLLIGGYKCDLRIYVLVKNIQPLTIFIYEEGLVRFSTHKFNLTDIRDKFCHLTNSSINKHNKEANSKQKPVIGKGSKWTLGQLREHLEGNGISYDKVFAEIEKIVVFSLLSMAQDVPGGAATLSQRFLQNNCFEFLGFDILIDQNLKPWLIEINGPPQMTIDSKVDVKVKYQMAKDMVRILFEIDQNKVMQFCQSNEASQGVVQRGMKNTSVFFMNG